MKKFFILLVIIGLVILVLYLTKTYPFSDGGEKKDSEYQTVTAERMDISPRVMCLGEIQPMVGAEVKVGSRVSGIVKTLNVGIGDYVEKGQLIAELDDTELKVRTAQNLASLEKARADMEYAETNLDRQKNLFEKNFISKQALDQAQNSYNVAVAQLKQAQANYESAKIQQSYAKIYATISGVIASVSTQEGETVAASLSAPTFVNIIDFDRLEIEAYIDETDIGRVSPGLEASFTVDTYPAVEFGGEVKAIYPKAEIRDNVVNYIALISIKDMQGRILRPEMTTNVTIYLERLPDSVVAPSRSLRREKGQWFVWVLENGKPVRKNVEIGIVDDGNTQIKSGLKAGEKIITSDVNIEA